MGGLTLPRVRVRSRRRKPRGPEWRRSAALCCANAFSLLVFLLSDEPLCAAASAIGLAVTWIDLHHAPCDPEARALTRREEAIGGAAACFALVLFVVGIVT